MTRATSRCILAITGVLIPGIEVISVLVGIYLKALTCGRSVGDMPLQTLQLIHLPRWRLSSSRDTTCACRTPGTPHWPPSVRGLPPGMAERGVSGPRTAGGDVMVDVAGRSIGLSLSSGSRRVRAAEVVWLMAVPCQDGETRPWPETCSQTALRRAVGLGTASDTPRPPSPLQTPSYGRELGGSPPQRVRTQGCVTSL